MAYKTYWKTWLGLLTLTLAMIAAGGRTLPRLLLLGVLLAAMLVKAGFIGGVFMHLRSETRALMLIVTLTIIGVSAALFFGIAPDGMRALALSDR